MYYCSIKPLFLLIISLMNKAKARATGAVMNGYVYAAVLIMASFCVLSVASCTKPEAERPIRVDTLLPPPSAPTGVIQEFSVQDSLVGYMRQTVIKWYVTGTNDLTEVRLNGVKLKDFSGAQQTGPLTDPVSVFTLSINNNVQRSKTIRVADSMTTALWNDGKRWRTIDTRTLTEDTIRLIGGADSVVYVWKSTFDAAARDKYRDFRTSFYLDNNSLEEQLSTNFPKPNPSGKFTIGFLGNNAPGTKYGMFWKSAVYRIDTLSLATRELVLYVDSFKNGKNTYNRIRYTPEF